AWAIDNNGAPRSRNTRLSRKVFLGKLFRVRVTTVKPRHRIMCPDGKVRQGNLLPEHLWYSKVECLLSLEVTNQWIRDFPSDTNGAIPISVTKILVNPFRQREIARGGVGRRELGDGNWVREAGFSRWGGQSSNAPNPVGGEGHLAAGPTPIHSTSGEQAPPAVAPPERRIGQCSRAE